MKRKHAQGPNAKQVKSMLTTARNNFIPGCFEHNDEFTPYTVTKTDDVITARLQPVDPTIKPLCEINYTIPKAWFDEIKLKDSDKKEPLVDEHENASVSSESAGLQTIIDDLRDELSETRTALDAVTLDRNLYKRVKELAECKLWDEQDLKDDLQAQIKELTDANAELTQKVQHLTVQNENLTKLLNHNSDNSTAELQLPKEEVRYIVFERTNLSKCFKTNSIDPVIYYINGQNSCDTYAFACDRIKSQLEKANVAMFHDHYIIKL